MVMSEIGQPAPHEAFSKTAKIIAQDPDLVAFAPEIGEPTKDEFDRFRPELYALLAIAVDKVFADTLTARDEAPPYGLLTDEGEPLTALTSFDQLGKALGNTLRHHLVSSFESMRHSELAPAVDRLGDVVALFHESYEGSRYETSEWLINSGIGTAAQELGNALDAIPRVVRREKPGASSEEVGIIARNSQLLVKRVASVNINHLPAAGAVVADAARDLAPGYDLHTNGLALKTSKDGVEYVDFVKPAVQTDDPYAGNAHRQIGERTTYFETLGCPALVKFNGESVVDKLWNWMVDIGVEAKLFDKFEAEEIF